MSPDPDLEALRHAALEATRGWTPSKASMALRATGLDSADGRRATLDAIAADLGVSRETVRRARNDLLHAMPPPPGRINDAISSSLSLSAPTRPSAESPATARALRRLLTITGPLPWDEVLNAWARAGGKPPYSLLPADLATMRIWAHEVGGFTVSAEDWAGGPATIATVLPEELDPVSQFLLDALREHPSGVDRHDLLELAGAAGLKATTVATTLSMHPAIIRMGRGRWALRGHRTRTSGPAPVPKPRRGERIRPTTFTWEVDGSLLIEFSIPRGPSPVVAVPKAVSEIVEGRDFTAEAGDKPQRIAVKGARMWGFGPLLSDLGLAVGSRVTIALNLLASTATITPSEEKGTSR